ncbi:large ribosomal subunit protein eL20z isoform X1 [Lolium perenne]|uniref:large ribosomal subunit protein eL20z isoform X1 n=1 Tax=Lolium perenne TaxID=4522 RepID=UPI0021F58283|nr:60S ribosomal protein L18a-like protein isoform X1 [Lolium perenne]
MSGDEGDKAKAGGGGGGGGGEYGTFQGPPSYPPPRPPVVGYPQPVQPPGLVGQRYSRNRGGYHSGAAQDTEAGVRGHGYDRLPCCGLGIGWVLFILGFIFGAIPWYAGALLLCFYKRDRREKPGFIACAVAAVIGTILIIIAVVVPSEVRVHHY